MGCSAVSGAFTAPLYLSVFLHLSSSLSLHPPTRKTSTLTSFQPASQTDAVWCSRASEWRIQIAIQGGFSVLFMCPHNPTDSTQMYCYWPSEGNRDNLVCPPNLTLQDLCKLCLTESLNLGTSSNVSSGNICVILKSWSVVSVIFPLRNLITAA